MAFSLNIPFLYRVSTGVHFAERHVWWVTFSRIGHHAQLQRVDREPIEGSVHRALCQLVDRVCPSSPYVATHLGPGSLREWTLRGPCFDRSVERTAWVERQVQHRLPTGVEPEAFLLRHRLLRRTPEHEVVLVGAARREALRRRHQLLARAGLKAACLGSLTETVGFAYGFRPRFGDGRAAILLTGRAGATLVEHDGGRLRRQWHLSHHEEPEALVAEAVEVLEAEGLEDGEVDMYAAGEAALQLETSPARDRLPVSTGSLLPGSDRLAAPGALAAGLALKQLYAPRRYHSHNASVAGRSRGEAGPESGKESLHIESYDFLSSRVREAAHAWADRQDALRAVLGAGLLVFFLVAVAHGGTRWLEGRVRETETALAASASDRGRLETVARELRLLEAHLQATRSLRTRRTHVAALLSRIGRVVPESLWVNDLTVKAETASKSTSDSESDETALEHAAVFLQGLSLSEGAVSHLVERLEQSQWFNDVRLSFIEQLSSGAAREEGAREGRLSRFKIRVRVPLVSARRTASPRSKQRGEPNAPWPGTSTREGQKELQPPIKAGEAP